MNQNDFAENSYHQLKKRVCGLGQIGHDAVMRDVPASRHSWPSIEEGSPSVEVQDF